MNIKLDEDTIRAMNVFSSVTGVSPRDCLISDDKLIFLVNQGQAGMAIGKNGIKIKVLESMMKKEVMVVEYSDDPVKFLENFIRPNLLISGYLTVGQEAEKQIHASIEGKVSGMRVKLLKTLMQRYFNIMSINIK
ncbi:NusA-like transcription termination signal-binding factor [Candidatus Parvarchaeota archaeon]|nr:NusA-like transcription termination signal-binding factor [Candidatus Parvarchaeota archaeon]